MNPQLNINEDRQADLTVHGEDKAIYIYPKKDQFKKIDNVYYDKDNEKSQQKILLEYMKAIAALTINDEYRLKKKIAEYEKKLKDVPKVERLESHLASKILEQEAIKKELEKFRTDKEKETQMMQRKYEQDMKAMREEMQNKFQQILAKIDVANLR